MTLLSLCHDKNNGHQHWRASQAQNALKTAPVLVFSCFLSECLM